jgi:hypothetical protein
VLDDNLFTKADNKDTAKCQLEMLRRADKLENTVMKEINKARGRPSRTKRSTAERRSRRSYGRFSLRTTESTGPRKGS